MKGKAAAFMAVLAIAAAFGLGAGIYLEHSASNYAFAGDIVYGERDSAGDFAVSESLVLSEHMRLSTLYSPAGGEGCAESGWGSFPRTDIWRPPSVEFDFTEAEVAGDVEDLLQDNALLRSIYEDISQEYDGSDDFLATFDLADYTDTYTVTPVLGSMDDGYVDLRGEPFGDMFYMPAPEGSIYSCELYRAGDRLRMLVTPLCTTRGESAFTSEGYVYFTFSIASESGEHPDGSTLPGGGWSVWRMPCEYQEEAKSGERWWTGTEEGYRADCDPEALENVYLLPESWQDVKLELSYDGQLVLVLTVEDGALYLTTLDSASGETVDRLELIDSERFAALGLEADFNGAAFRHFSKPGYSVFLLDGRVAVVVGYDAGNCEALLVADTGCDARPDYVREENYIASSFVLDCAYDGERVAVLRETTVRGRTDDYLHCLVLNVAGEDGLEYSEWLNGPFALGQPGNGRLERSLETGGGQNEK